MPSNQTVARLEEQLRRRRDSKWQSFAGSEELTKASTSCFRMMFDHPLGTPLGLHRKPSRVESAKRFWRVSLILSDGREILSVCVCVK